MEYIPEEYKIREMYNKYVLENGETVIRDNYKNQRSV